ncbi:UDP-glucose 4-epimerase GalE [Novosphingobium pentaromativorans]|uniref:UDP-glucose 4-epimerase n=1 Tax=Novosphingobium pentaromativorans US6-1 TaxID=1088721 RepID=G6E9S9_9SPHN|nr:UDP-glucose 4-epimerase GalE [Novosphingobium pentaromativorans]AIT80920.1 UDP-glucose 4-epimerase [Novosphingobium pentaromativorans US6-1]EHJ61934.1 UDP-glucose 4-epimerase [Novosphingobium pentaromativorans US6-1]
MTPGKSDSKSRGTILVTGGAGYVGSHCCKAFAQAGWQVVTYDNLSRGHADAVRWGPLVVGDILDADALDAAFAQYKPDLVGHFAAFAYVEESVRKPELYYHNNSIGSFTLLDRMRAAGIDKLIFSSTCASYGVPTRVPIDEAHPQSPINPYGWSKFMVERMLSDYASAHGLDSVALRYFNAAGCDPDGEIGECHDPETHAIPLAIEGALAADRPFTVFGTDFDTRDGSAVRDYIHVSDLAAAHVLAGEWIMDRKGFHPFNLGTGNGTTVLEIAEAVARICGVDRPAQLGPRRAGDPPVLIADAAKAREELGWIPRHSDIDTIVRTAVAWYRKFADRTLEKAPA